MRRGFFSFFLTFFCFFSFFSPFLAQLYTQGHEKGNHPFVIRGEVFVDFEPIYAGHVDEEYPLSSEQAGRRALDEAALFFSAMIYGWSFNYEVGERARLIKEDMELQNLGEIKAGDPALKVTDTEIREMRFRMWADYHLNDSQQRRMEIWRTGMIRNAQGTGYGPSHIDEYPGWIELKKMALEDAARAALRATMRGSERNRPKEVKGLISLASFPRYYISAGRWAAFARFRVQVTEIIPFAAY